MYAYFLKPFFRILTNRERKGNFNRPRHCSVTIAQTPSPHIGHHKL